MCQLWHILLRLFIVKKQLGIFLNHELLEFNEFFKDYYFKFHEQKCWHFSN